MPPLIEICEPLPLPMDWSTQFRLIGMPRFDLQVSFLEDSPSMWLVCNQLCFGCCFSGAANIIQVHMLLKFLCGFRELCLRQLFWTD